MYLLPVLLSFQNELPVNSFILRFYLFIFREGKGRERNIDVREKHRSFVSCMRPDQGPNPQPRGVH